MRKVSLSSKLFFPFLRFHVFSNSFQFQFTLISIVSIEHFLLSEGTWIDMSHYVWHADFRGLQNGEVALGVQVYYDSYWKNWSCSYLLCCATYFHSHNKITNSIELYVYILESANSFLTANGLTKSLSMKIAWR